jgi:DNA transposition AAA+ family ATPase
MGNKADRQNELRELIGGMLKNSAVDLSQTGMAKRIGVSCAALNQWLQGKYKGSNEAIEEKLERWLESYSAGQEYTSELPPKPGWVETPTARRIFQTLEMGQFLKELVIAYGAPGTGKTMTSEHYAVTKPNVWLVTPTKASASVRGILMLMCDKLGISDPGSGNYIIQKEIMKKISGTNGLLIIDEAQQLTVSALDLLRQIHEQAGGVGLALVGNEPLYNQMTGGFRLQKFAQLFRRIAQRTHIEGTLAEDVAAMCEAIGITDDDAVEYLSRIGTLPGGLGGIATTIQMAQLASAGSGIELNKAVLARAWRKLTNA